jgi:hypothetical protein
MVNNSTNTTKITITYMYFLKKPNTKKRGLLWRAVLLVVETGGPGENYRPVASHWEIWSHNVVLLALAGVEPIISVVIGTDCVVVGLIITYAIGAYHHWYYGFDSRQGEEYNIMWSNFSVTCDRSVVFSGSSGFLHQ